MIDMLLQTYASTEVQSLNDNWPQWQLYILYNRRSLAKRQASGKISGLHPEESPQKILQPLIPNPIFALSRNPDGSFQHLGIPGMLSITNLAPLLL